MWAAAELLQLPRGREPAGEMQRSWPRLFWMLSVGCCPLGVGLPAHLGFTPLFSEGLGPGTSGGSPREGREEGPTFLSSLNPASSRVGSEVLLVRGPWTFPGRERTLDFPGLQNQKMLGSEGL